MHFKQPELLYFLLLLILPILVHLFQLRRFKKAYFTNVRFLKEISIQTRKSSKIKKWLLLATRLLLLTCIILAFAQPFFKAKDNKNASNEMYIVLDNSYSMQAKGQRGELLKRAVQELLENIPEELNFSLITNTDAYWNTDVKSIYNDLQNLNYSGLPFDIQSTLAKIKSRKSMGNKDVVIITDAIGIETRQLNSIGEDLNSYFIVPEAEQKNNISIDSVYIHQSLEDFYEIGLELSSFGDQGQEIPVSLYNQNKLIAKTLTKLEKNKKSIFFTIPKADFHGYASIIDNGMDYDNQLFFSISKPKRTRVISIGPEEKASYLSRIYTSDEFDYVNYSLESLNYNILDKQNTIVLNEIETIPQALQTTLKSFVEKGGNLVLVPSSKIAIDHLNSFLKVFTNVQFSAFQNKEKLITKINFDHPLFSQVFENKVSNFQYPKVKSSFEQVGSAPAALNFEDQSSFLMAATGRTNGFGDVYIFSAPINTENSNFQQSPLIVPVFYKMGVNKLNNTVFALTIGRKNSCIVDSALSKDEILKVKNSTDSYIPEQQMLSNKVKLVFKDVPSKAGNYEIYNEKDLLQKLSFNYNRSESNLYQSSESALSDFDTFDSIATVLNKLQTDRTDNTIWKWFVIFALLFIIAELAIIRLLK